MDIHKPHHHIPKPWYRSNPFQIVASYHNLRIESYFSILFGVIPKFSPVNSPGARFSTALGRCSTSSTSHEHNWCILVLHSGHLLSAHSRWTQYKYGQRVIFIYIYICVYVYIYIYIHMYMYIPNRGTHTHIRRHDHSPLCAFRSSRHRCHAALRGSWRSSGKRKRPMPPDAPRTSAWRHRKKWQGWARWDDDEIGFHFQVMWLRQYKYSPNNNEL